LGRIVSVNIYFSFQGEYMKINEVMVIGVISMSYFGCDDKDEDLEPVESEDCASGLMWVGDEESPNMNPGESCIACHTAEDEGPIYSAAGTVYEELDEADDCFGVEGVEVEITDAGGSVFSMISNEAGNFFLSSQQSIEVPYTAKVIYNGMERTMASSQTNTDCASCHTSSGSDGAPGRVQIPQ
jgi:hypothetical protein